jgi:hypothetical protein
MVERTELYHLGIHPWPAQSFLLLYETPAGVSAPAAEASAWQGQLSAAKAQGRATPLLDGTFVRLWRIDEVAGRAAGP